VEEGNAGLAGERGKYDETGEAGTEVGGAGNLDEIRRGYWKK
jgi:hypothetical protein